MLDALRTAAAPVTDPGRRRQLRDQGDRLMAQSRLALGGPDLAEVEDRYATFLRAFED